MVENAEITEDGLFGQRVARLRGATSQKALADAMRERGWKWSQMTVYLIERGERSLKLKEAPDLANLLGVQVMDLFEDPEILNTEAEFKELVQDLHREYNAAVSSLRNLQLTHDLLQSRASALITDERFKRLLQFAEFNLRFTVEMAVMDARQPQRESGPNRPASRRGIGAGRGVLYPETPGGLD